MSIKEQCTERQLDRSHNKRGTLRGTPSFDTMADAELGGICKQMFIKLLFVGDEWTLRKEDIHATHVACPFSDILTEVSPTSKYRRSMTLGNGSHSTVL